MLRSSFPTRWVDLQGAKPVPRLFALLLALLGGLFGAQTAELPSFDFTVQNGSEGWVAQHDVALAAGAGEGLILTITGADPYTAGPARDYPAAAQLWLRVRLRSEQAGTAQVFFFRDHPTEEDSVRFPVPSGSWHEARVPMPALGAGYRLRFDPPGAGGKCAVAWIRFEERIKYPSPNWGKPSVPVVDGDAPALASGDLQIVHGRGFGAFHLLVDGKRMAIGNQDAQLGYLKQGKPVWVKLDTASGAVVRVYAQPLEQLADRQVGGRITAKVETLDLDGGRWEISQVFSLGMAGTLSVETVVQVDQDRDVLYLPVFTMLAGVGTFGTNKTQALLAGVEYLENEPSSSTADLNAPASDRQVPDVAKLTFPLMAICAEERYMAMAWNREGSEDFCATFDSPDRFYGSGGHLLGIAFPGSDGARREENSLLPYDPLKLTANRQLRFSHLLLGGRGSTVVPAVQRYVQLFGLPALPRAVRTSEIFERTARGWLDSKIREGDTFRHAAPGFRAMASSDAALFMEWLAGKVEDRALAERLRVASAKALSVVPNGGLLSSQIGHVRTPAPGLAYGGIAACLRQQLTEGKSLVRRFGPDGTILYRRISGSLDFGRTHWSPHANGMAAEALARVLRAAVLTRDQGLVTDGLRLLRACRVTYRETVPRGAQTWEIPLHTPDILAAAHLVESFVLGYELSGESDLLDEAKYWGWTGVPFVYLSPPVNQPVGSYSTIAVLGATSWVAPNWIGLPVQWCGLVYADALQQLAVHDPKGPWKRLADGICLAGAQHTYEADDADYVGLLPDSYNLRAQTRNGPAINPATLLAPSVKSLTDEWVYDRSMLVGGRVDVHAPGRIGGLKETADGMEFEVANWRKGTAWTLVSGLQTRPEVRLNGERIEVGPACEWHSEEGWLVIQVRDQAKVRLRWENRPSAP